MLAGMTAAEDKEAKESTANIYFDMITVGYQDVCTMTWDITYDIQYEEVKTAQLLSLTIAKNVFGADRQVENSCSRLKRAPLAAKCPPFGKH